MSKLRTMPEDATSYRDMTQQLLPRGPIWKSSGTTGFMGGLGVEAIRFHNRVVALMREAFPSTADELLATWESDFGLPLCAVPADDDGRRTALAGKVAAQGGQSRAYFITLAWAVLEAGGEYSRAADPDLVTITERPYGRPFVAWGSTAWEAAAPPGAMFYWTLNLPVGVSAAKEAIIECLLCRYKPAHTVLVRADGSVVCETLGEPDEPSPAGFYYHLPGSGSDDIAEATTEVAGNILGVGSALLWWMRVTAAAEGGNLIESSKSTQAGFEVYLAAGGDFILNLDVSNGLHGGGSGASAGLPFGQWDFYSVELADADGVGRIYRNGSLLLTTSGSPPDPGESVTITAFLRFMGVNSNAVDIANIKPMARELTAGERAALYAAGPQHDYRVATGEWVGDDGAVVWRDEDVAGVVPNAGTGGTCGLELQGDATSEEF